MCRFFPMHSTAERTAGFNWVRAEGGHAAGKLPFECVALCQPHPYLKQHVDGAMGFLLLQRWPRVVEKAARWQQPSSSRANAS